MRKADQTPEVILKLFRLLDYILYQSSKPLVSLREELDHLMNYESLGKIRFHDTLIMTFDRSILTSPLELPPMLLLPLLENAFKHGAVINNVLEVRVHCAYKDQRLCFRVTNTVQSKTTKNKSGLGLSISKKRLCTTVSAKI